MFGTLLFAINLAVIFGLKLISKTPPDGSDDKGPDHPCG